MATHYNQEFIANRLGECQTAVQVVSNKPIKYFQIRLHFHISTISINYHIVTTL